ncbi:MAG: MBL fold metallo-hydrolase [Chitinophagaceae bacterium]|nr:MBL fold metallo-hydrolase [Chitinophagaceae bacterium]
MELIKARIKDEALVAEMDSLLTDDKQYHLWWLGQSGYLLQWKGKRVLLDPYLSDSLTQKYAATDKPHTRMSEQVIRPELLRGISVVTSSHNHTDHLDAETLIPVLQNNPGIKFIIPEANREFVCERVKCAIDLPVGLNDGDKITVDGFTFHGVPAKHNEIDRDAFGNCRYMGYVITFDGHAIYHSGDTLWFDEMESILKPFNIETALLPINGNKPERKVAGNLDAEEAVRLGRLLGVKTVIPCHYNMFAFNTADPAEFEKLATANGVPHRVLQGGERFSY